MKSLKEIADKKSWFAEDESLKHAGKDSYGCDRYKWYTSEKYITSTQVRMAISDPDVEVGEIEKHSKVGFYIDIRDVRNV